jgi:hypothetical protein
LYRGKLFSVVDELVGEFEMRFTSNDELLHAMDAFNPHCPSFLSADSLMIITDKYTQLEVVTDRLPGQCEVAKNMLGADLAGRPSTATKAYSKLSFFQQHFQILFLVST